MESDVLFSMQDGKDKKTRGKRKSKTEFVEK